MANGRPGTGNPVQNEREDGYCAAELQRLALIDFDPRYREPVYRTVGKWLKGVYPVSTGIVISGLARPEWVVEIDAIAVIPES